MCSSWGVSTFHLQGLLIRIHFNAVQLWRMWNSVASWQRQRLTGLWGAHSYMHSLCPIDRLCGNGAFGVAVLSVEHSLAAMVSLERITIPLKYGMIDEDMFQGCYNLASWSSWWSFDAWKCFCSAIEGLEKWCVRKYWCDQLDSSHYSCYWTGRWGGGE